MIYLKRLIFRKWNTLFFALVFLLLFTAVPYGFYQSWNANLNMMEAVENIERGSYDILLRPRVSSMGTEANLKTLDESFASNIGQFSFEWDQWEKIEHDLEPLIEEELEKEIGSSPVPRRGDGFTFEEWQELVNDPRIEMAVPIATLGFMDSVQQTVSLPIQKSPGNYRYNVQFYTTDGLNDYLLETHVKYLLEGESDSLELEEVNFQIPLSSHLLVAVDPVLEQEMTGIDLSPLLNKTDQESEDFIKILQRNQLTTPLMVRIEVEEFEVEVDWDSLELSGEEALTDFSDELESYSIIKQTYIETDLTPALKPFSGGLVRIQEDGSLVNIESDHPYILPESFLILDPVEYKVPGYDVEPSSRYDSNLSVEKIASEEIPIYRRRNTMAYIGEPRPPLFMTTVGSFDPNEYIPPTLTAAPLGIYSIPTVLTESNQLFIPTARAGSFMAQAASGITTLEVAQQIKGDQFIDAIRIRVADIDQFDVAARQQINELATELANQRHDVTIVAGSARTQQTLEVEDVGEVDLPWISINAVPGMAKNFDILTFTTIVLFTVFMLIWLSCRLKAEKSLLSEESEILTHIGWTKGQLRAHELKSQQLFLVLLNISSWGLLYRLNVPITLYFISVGLLFAALAVPYAMHFKYKICFWRKPFKAGQAVQYYWEYYMPIIVLLWVSYQVITIITASQFRILLNFNATEVGQSLLTPVHSLLIFLLILAYLMTVIAVFESITVILRERKDEFLLYQLIGWKPKTIYLYLVKESVQWLFHPLLSAAASSVIISLLLSFILGGTIVFFILAALILGAFYVTTERKILWNLTTWNWALLLSALTAALILGSVYSPALVVPTLLISLFTLCSISILILITMYICFKKFYKSI